MPTSIQADPTVFIVDDDTLLCAWVEQIVRANGHASASFSSAEDFLAKFDAQLPGCVICDVCMPGQTGLELQQQLNRMGAIWPVIFMTAHKDVPTAVAAMRHGAFDFVLKPFNETELMTRVHSAVARDRLLRQELLELKAVRARCEALTPRERDVFRLLAAGKSNKVMAAELHLSMRTVELHRARVMEKMAAPSLAHLVRMSIDLESSRFLP